MHQHYVIDHSGVVIDGPFDWAYTASRVAAELNRAWGPSDTGEPLFRVSRYSPSCGPALNDNDDAADDLHSLLVQHGVYGGY